VSGSGPERVNMFHGPWQDAFPDNQIRTVTRAEGGRTGILEAVLRGHTCPRSLGSSSWPCPRAPEGRRPSAIACDRLPAL
jgi:hypothetical protein